MFFLEAADESVPAFRSVWASYGGSIVIVGGNGLYKCHIHTDDDRRRPSKRPSRSAGLAISR